MRALTSIASALIAGILIAGLSGCGGVQAPTSKVKAEHSAAEQDYEPAEFMGMLIAAQKKSGSMHMSLYSEPTGTFDGMQFDEYLRFDNGDGLPAMSISMETKKASFVLRLVGGKTYYADDSVPLGKYVLIDPADTSNPLSGLAAGFTTLDPAALSEDIAAAATDVTRVGAEDVFGMPATHYRVTIDPSKVTGPTAKSFQRLAIGSDITYDYWLNAENLPLQLKYAMEIQGQLVKSTAQMREWGTVRTIPVPTAEQLVTLEELGLGG